MARRIAAIVFVCLCALEIQLHAQEFKLFDHELQAHGWFSQGFVKIEVGIPFDPGR